MPVIPAQVFLVGNCLLHVWYTGDYSNNDPKLFLKSLMSSAHTTLSGNEYQSLTTLSLNDCLRKFSCPSCFLSFSTRPLVLVELESGSKFSWSILSFPVSIFHTWIISPLSLLNNNNGSFSFWSLSSGREIFSGLAEFCRSSFYLFHLVNVASKLMNTRRILIFKKRPDHGHVEFLDDRGPSLHQPL